MYNGHSNVHLEPPPISFAQSSLALCFPSMDPAMMEAMMEDDGEDDKQSGMPRLCVFLLWCVFRVVFFRLNFNGGVHVSRLLLTPAVV